MNTLSGLYTPPPFLSLFNLLLFIYLFIYLSFYLQYLLEVRCMLQYFFTDIAFSVPLLLTIRYMVTNDKLHYQV